MPQWFPIVVAGVLGLLFGSFANVVIWRVPRAESISSPGSHCPACGAAIAWYDNVPLVSYVLLRGRCRRCNVHISARYPAVEAASGALFVIAAVRYDTGSQAAFAAVLFWGLLVLGLIDVGHLRLPNPIVGGLAVVGLVGAMLSQVLHTPLVPLVGTRAAGPLAQPLVAALVGALAAGGLSFLIAEGYARARGRQGFGMGDVKLLGVLGLYLGLYALMAFVVGSVLGSVYAITRSRVTGASLAGVRLPFGGFLALGAVVCALVGQPAWLWYLRAVGLS